MRVRSLCAAALALSACAAPERGPNLIELSELRPRHVEVGDRLHVSGAGFPEGRFAQLRLNGDLLRAGEPPLENVEIRAEAELVSPHGLEVSVTRALAAKFSGNPDGRHTTFRGDLEVAFAPRTSSGSAVTGHLDGVVVDVTPETTSESALAALHAQGERFSRFIGVGVEASDDGVSLVSVEPRSLGARAGLAPGDTLLELDGMIVRGVSDLVPPPNAKLVPISIRRGNEELSLRLDCTGFRYSSPETLSTAIVLLGITLFGFLLLGSPLGRVLAFFEGRVIERLREAEPRLAGETLSPSILKSAVRGLGQKLPNSFLPYFALVGASTLFTLLALGKSVVASELDLLLVPAATAFGLLLAAFASGGERRWSLRGALARAGSVLALVVPLGAVIVTVALDAGTLRADDLVRAQGSFPWQWSGFKSPLLLVAALLTLAGLVPLSGQIPALRGREKRRARDVLLGLLQGIHELVTVFVLAVMVFGGWHLVDSSSSLSVSVLGALLLLFKGWALLLVVAVVRWALGNVEAKALGRAAYIFVAVPSALSAFAALLLSRAAQTPVFSTLQAGMGPALLFSSLFAIGWLWFRIVQGVKSPSTDLRIQPWV